LENKLIDEMLRKFNIDYEEDLRHKLNSIKIVSLIMEIEEMFNVEIKEIDFVKTNSVKKIIYEFVNNK
jgi:acyl carrier protein